MFLSFLPNSQAPHTQIQCRAQPRRVKHKMCYPLCPFRSLHRKTAHYPTAPDGQQIAPRVSAQPTQSIGPLKRPKVLHTRHVTLLLPGHPWLQDIAHSAFWSPLAALGCLGSCAQHKENTRTLSLKVLLSGRLWLLLAALTIPLCPTQRKH